MVGNEYESLIVFEPLPARRRMGRIVPPSNRTPGWSRRKSLSVADGVTFEQNDVNGLLRYFGHGAGDSGPFFEGPKIAIAATVQDRGPASFADLVDLFEVVALNRVDEDHG
jgi:hypothetical protein